MNVVGCNTRSTRQVSRKHNEEIGISVYPNLAGWQYVRLAPFINSVILRCPMDNTDFDMMFNMPSGDDFREVTDVFKEASRGEPVLQCEMGRSLTDILRRYGTRRYGVHRWILSTRCYECP